MSEMLEVFEIEGVIRREAECLQCMKCLNWTGVLEGNGNACNV